MSEKVTSFHTGYASACFVTDDGSVKFIGDSGKSGVFGYWSKSIGTVSTVSKGRVSVNSIGDKTFRPPPHDMGRIVKAKLSYHATFAIDESGKMSVWGSVKKKLWETIPHNIKMKDIFINNFMWVFVPQSGNNVVILNSRYDSNPLMLFMRDRIESSTAGISQVSYSYNTAFIKHDDGSAYVCMRKDGDDDKFEIKSFIIPKCDWIASDGYRIAWKSDGEVRKLDISDRSHYHTTTMELYGDRLNTAVDVHGDFDYLTFLDRDNCIYTPTMRGWGGDNEMVSIQLGDKPLAFDGNYALTANNRIIPIREMKWSGASMILSAFPEWADDEDFVLDLVRISPSNFAHASSRLRKSIEFSKKVASFGPEHLKYVDGMIRRNRELRSYKRLYEITESGRS